MRYSIYICFCIFLFSIVNCASSLFTFDPAIKVSILWAATHSVSEESDTSPPASALRQTQTGMNLTISPTAAKMEITLQSAPIWREKKKFKTQSQETKAGTQKQKYQWLTDTANTSIV